VAETTTEVSGRTDDETGAGAGAGAGSGSGADFLARLAGAVFSNRSELLSAVTGVTETEGSAGLDGAAPTMEKEITPFLFGAV